MTSKYRPKLEYKVKKPLGKVIGAFDIETIPSAEWAAGWNKHKKDYPDAEYDDGCLFGDYTDGFIKYDDDDTYYRCNTMLEMCQQILTRGDVVLYAHNAKGYEFKYAIKIFQEYYPDLKIETLLSGDQHVIALIIPHEDGKIELRDSLALIPMTLEQACQKLKTKHQKSKMVKGHHYDRNNPLDVEYCRNDVQCTIEIVQKIMDLTYEVFGCGIAFTTAATAMACFKSTIPKGHSYYRLNPPVEEFCRKGYYGGYVYCGRDVHVHDDIISVDRNASFAASMRDGVPVGKGRIAYEEEEGKLGIFLCKVFAPQSVNIPCVPIKTIDGLKWPIGTFETTITTDEMLFAREQGYIIEPIRGILWDRVEYPFNAIVDKCEKIEIEQPELKEFIKLIRNALYGKFGSKFWSKEVVIGMPESIEGWSPLIDDRTGTLDPYCWVREVYNEAEYIMPHWASFITARARLWVFRAMLAVGMEHVRYGDTDSVKADAEAVKAAIREGRLQVCVPKKDLADASKWVQEYVQMGLISTEVKYGACKVDEEYTWFQTLGPKVYHGKLTNDKDKMRAKGIPGKKLKHSLYEFAYAGIKSGDECDQKFKDTYFKRVGIRSSNSTMVLLKKRNATIDRQVDRSLTNFSNSRTWVVTADGSIYPPTLCEW